MDPDCLPREDFFLADLEQCFETPAVVIQLKKRGGEPMKQYSGLNKIGLILMLGLIICLSGCAFTDLKKEITEAEKTYALAGRVTLPSGPRGSVIVLLYSQKEGRNEMVGYTIAADTGHFSFFMPKGIYFLAAFEDLDNNLSHDQGEPAGYFGAPDPIALPPKGRASTRENELLSLDFRLKETARFPSGFTATIDPQKIGRSVFVKFGQITTLDDKMFSPENGSLGYWKPLTFLRDFGIGVYFLEPYDPEKIPVLFIHGAVGNPADWKKTVDQMDRSKFQPWFYYYPSGIRLDDAASALNEIIKRIHAAYGFKTLYVTAQSMGGLWPDHLSCETCTRTSRITSNCLSLFQPPGTVTGSRQKASRGRRLRFPAGMTWYPGANLFSRSIKTNSRLI